MAACPGRARHALALTLSVVLLALLSRDASAWKPRHHIVTGDEAVATILAGKDSVWIDGRGYPVPPEVARSIRDQPAYFRAGCIGPDGFPDLLFGQTLIHPDWKKDGGTYSYKWLWLVHASGWAYYKEHQGDATGEQGLAFAYGYLTHAAGDLWGHTFINGFAGGSWPEIPGGDLSIAVRHILVEGYVTERIPPADMTVAVPYDFIRRTFITNRNADIYTRADDMKFGIPYFRHLRASLQETYNGLRCRWYFPWEWVNCAMRAYLEAWMADIDAGLAAWPERMARVGQHWLVDTYPGHMDDGMADLKAFAYDHLLSMYGAPDFIGSFLSGWDALMSWIEGLIGWHIPTIGDLIVYIVEQTYGIDFDSLKEYFTDPSHYIDVPPLFATDTSERLDAYMHLKGGTFDPDSFAAHRNTVLTAKMLLLAPATMDSLLAHYGAAPLYSVADSPLPPDQRENVMVGWIRSLDEDHQWRRTPYGQPDLVHSEGFPLWNDCSTRDRVFRRLFVDWETHAVAANFPDDDEPCQCRSDLPPSIAVSLDREVLWPASGRLVTVNATVSVQDDCDPDARFELIAIRCDEPASDHGHGERRADVVGAEYGTADTQFQLRATRDHEGDGRTYTVCYAGLDDTGNADTIEVTVRVPLDVPGLARGSAGVTLAAAGAPDAEPFTLVVPSATLESAARPGVLALAAGRAFLGNHLGRVPAAAVATEDVTGDGLEDVVLAFPREATLALLRRSAGERAAVALRYEDRAGVGYLVSDVAPLGIALGPQVADAPPAAGADESLALLRPAPNPFSSSMRIGFVVPAPGAAVRFAIHDIAGREVQRLTDGFLAGGTHVVAWDGRGSAGTRMSPGVYFVRGVIAGKPQTWRVVLLP